MVRTHTKQKTIENLLLYSIVGIYVSKISSFPLVELSRPGRGFVVAVVVVSDFQGGE